MTSSMRKPRVEDADLDINALFAHLREQPLYYEWDIMKEIERQIAKKIYDRRRKEEIDGQTN